MSRRITERTTALDTVVSIKNIGTGRDTVYVQDISASFYRGATLKVKRIYMGDFSVRGRCLPCLCLQPLADGRPVLMTPGLSPVPPQPVGSAPSKAMAEYVLNHPVGTVNTVLWNRGQVCGSPHAVLVWQPPSLATL